MDTNGHLYSIKEEPEILSEEYKCGEVYRHPKKIGIFIYICRTCNKHFEKPINFEYHIAAGQCNNSTTVGFTNVNVKCENSDIYSLCDIDINDDNSAFDDFDDIEDEKDEHFLAVPHTIFSSTNDDTAAVFASTTTTTTFNDNNTNVVKKKKRKSKPPSNASNELKKEKHLTLTKNKVAGHRFCLECNEQIPTKLMKKHKQNHNPWLYCDFCGHKSKLKGNLLTHILSKHTEDKPFKCDLCEKTFRAHHYLETHLRIHRREPTDQCHFCGKSFYGTNNYREHLKQTHLNMKRSYQCKLCDKKYTKSEKLNIHMRAVHTGERPFVCALCGKAFAAKRYLLQHNNIHLEEKQFKCKYCGLAFAQKVGKRAHERRLHEKEMILA